MSDVLLQAADAVLEARRARASPTAAPGLGVARCRAGTRRVGGSWLRCRQVGEVGHAPRLGAVGEVAVGQDDHRRHVLDGDAPGLDGMSKQSAGVAGGEDGDRALAVAAEDGLQAGPTCSVLVGRPGRRAAALHVDDDAAAARSSRRGRCASDLSATPGPAGAGHAHEPAEGRADGRADGRDLVLGLERLDAEVRSRDSSCRMSQAGVIG